jgi:ATP-dependent Lon protease
LKKYNDVGHSYDLIFGPYLVGARAVTIEEPYVRAPHQIENFVRFCETVVKAAQTVRRIHLISSYDDKTDLASVRDKLEELKQTLMEVDVFLEIEFKANLHDREVRIDNGWTVKIGRGLDFFQKPESWFSIGANDMSLRRCLETKVDIFRSS